MRESLKHRNMRILSRYHELTLSTKKLEKQKQIEIAEEMGTTQTTVKRVISKYYNDFLAQLGTKNTCLEGLTELKERFKFENLTEKQIEYMVHKLFGASDTQAAKKAGYKSKGSITNLKRNQSIQEFIESERRKVLQNTKYTFEYNYNSLGQIADKAKEIIKERSVTEKQGGKNGQELTKNVVEKHLLGVSANATAIMNKMVGFNYDEAIKEKKVDIDREKLALDKQKLKHETELEVLKANIEVLNLEILTGNTDIEDDVKDIQGDLNKWTEEAWKDEEKAD